MTVHIIGGGVAGLAAAIESVRRGLHLCLYEAAPELGGRARTYFSATLNTNIDNGAHAVLQSNASVQDYLVLCGNSHALTAYATNGLPFYDVRTRIKSRFKIPAALWDKTARPTDIQLSDLIAGLKLFLSSAQRTAADALRARPDAIAALWEPLCTSALNTPLSKASAATLATVVRQMASPGGLRAGLYLPKESLSGTYIAPAEQWLLERGAIIERGTPLRALQTNGQRVTALAFDKPVLIGSDDTVIFALPPWSPLLRAARIDTSAFTYAPIVNAHFKLDTPAPDQFIGLVGGHGQWLWVRGGIASVTISAADALNAMDADAIAQTLWAEIAPLLNLPLAPLPLAHVIKERRATLRHTLGTDRHRPGTATVFENLFLAGDWVVPDLKHPLPCTLENAIQSGFAAAKRAVDGSKHS